MLNPGLTEKLDTSTLEELTTLTAGNYSLRLVTSGAYTYVGQADPGSAEGSAVWQIKRIDETSGLITLWADGDSLFDNIWSNYASLTYS